MYNSYIMRRTQIYLEEAQHRKLAERARAGGVSTSSLIRKAIDAYLAKDLDSGLRLERWRAVVGEVAGVAPYLPEGHRYVEQLRLLDRGRWEELEGGGRP